MGGVALVYMRQPRFSYIKRKEECNYSLRTSDFLENVHLSHSSVRLLR